MFVAFGVAVVVEVRVGLGVGLRVGITLNVGLLIGVADGWTPPRTTIEPSLAVQSISVQVRGGWVPQGSLNEQPNGIDGVSVKLSALMPLPSAWKVTTAINMLWLLVTGVGHVNVMVTRPDTPRSDCSLHPLSPEGGMI